MNSGLSIKNLTAFAVAFMLVFGCGLFGSSLIPDAPGIAWADDDDDDDEETAPIVIGGYAGHQIYGPGAGLQPVYTERERQAQKNSACRAAAKVAQAAGATVTGAGGSAVGWFSCAKAGAKSKNKKAKAAASLACALAAGAAIGACLGADVTALP